MKISAMPGCCTAFIVSELGHVHGHPRFETFERFAYRMRQIAVSGGAMIANTVPEQGIEEGYLERLGFEKGYKQGRMQFWFGTGTKLQSVPLPKIEFLEVPRVGSLWLGRRGMMYTGSTIFRVDIPAIGLEDDRIPLSCSYDGGKTFQILPVADRPYLSNFFRYYEPYQKTVNSTALAEKTKL